MFRCDECGAEKQKITRPIFGDTQGMPEELLWECPKCVNEQLALSLKDINCGKTYDVKDLITEAQGGPAPLMECEKPVREVIQDFLNDKDSTGEVRLARLCGTVCRRENFVRDQLGARIRIIWEALAFDINDLPKQLHRDAVSLARIEADVLLNEIALILARDILSDE